MDDDNPGVPEWVVTYGDMMSLLLTFFIMLVSLSEVVADQKYRAILNSLQQYIGYRSSPSGPPGESFPLNSVIASLETMLGSFTNRENGLGGIKNQSIAGQHIRVLRTRDGAATTAGVPIFFEQGEVALSDEARQKITEIKALVAGKPNKIEIRAHVSPGPLPPDSIYADKIVITYLRARNIARLLEKLGIVRERLRIGAAGDSEPPRKTGEKRSQRYDRAEVLILDAFARSFVGPRDDSE